MPSLPTFLKPVGFDGADAAAYRVKADHRDAIALRLFAMLAILTLVSRFIIDGSLAPEATALTAPFRLSAIATMAGLLLVTLHRRIGSFLHVAAGVGLSALAFQTSLIHARAPTFFPYALTSVWLAIFLFGSFSFRSRLIVLIVTLAAFLPAVAMPVAGVWPDPLTSLLPLGVLISALSLMMSYALEQYWRRAFQRDLDLAASHEELRRTHMRLGEAYETLKDTQAQLVKAEKTAALGRLVANVAHRINTPNGNVLAMASHADESLRKFSERALNGTIRRSDLAAFLDAMLEGNDIVLTNAQRTAGLIDMFKCLVADAGERPGRMDAASLLTGLRPSLEALMVPGVTLAVDAPPDLEIVAPWHVMEAVAGELLRNAVTHAFPDGRHGTVTIRARAAADGDGVELQVIDDGRGIAVEHLEHVFDPFYTDGSIGGGHGLGLSIVHNAVVGPLGGRIAIDSRVGQGTTVTIRLPAAKAEGMDAADGGREPTSLAV